MLENLLDGYAAVLLAVARVVAGDVSRDFGSSPAGQRAVHFLVWDSGFLGRVVGDPLRVLAAVGVVAIDADVDLRQINA